MKLQHSQRYAASVGAVHAMLTDPEFRRKVGQAQDARSVEVTVDGGTVVLEMVTPNTGIPGFARAFAGETTRAVTTERWRDAVEADFAVETPGKPSSISGVRRLVADSDGTLDTFEVEIRAKVPLIGGKIESLIGTQFKDGCVKEHAVGVAWLSGER